MPLILGGVALVAIVVYLAVRPKSSSPPAAETPAAATAASTPGSASPNEAGKNFTVPRPPPVAVSVSAPTPAPAAAARPAEPVAAAVPSEALRESVAALMKLDLSQGKLSATELEAYKRSVQSLLAQGQGAFVGATSQLTPAQIERLATNLKALAPDQAGPFAVAAANAALAAAGKAETKEDVGPLFRVLQENGGAEAVGQLESLANNWKYYSTIALANLPDNAGISSLVRMVSDTDSPARGSRNAALQALAQVAPNSPEALAVLQDQAKAGSIPLPTWINIASVLGGHEFQIGTMSADQLPAEQAGSNMKSWHLELTKEDFYSTANPGKYSDEQIKQRQQIIANLIANLPSTSDPAIKQLLEQASGGLNRAPAPAPQN